MSMMDLVGQTLGQYRIEAPLDAGGMGQVFRGVHIYLDRPAAIKIMRANLATNPKFQARFLQEAKSAAALKHPNIVSIYEFGEQNGLLYLVMELMTDGSLRGLLQRRTHGQSWPLSLGLDLVRQAAEGLAAAHAQQVIHRDIKPDNLMLNRLGAAGRGPEMYELKISDFGLARLAEGSGLTATNATMGTFAYMSPEQCIGGKLDGRTDLYSLGIVLYEVATGYLPFQIDNFKEALDKHLHATPPPPRQVRPDLPAGLEEVILRSLAKKPEDRYATGTEMAQALQKILGNASGSTVAPTDPWSDATVADGTAFPAPRSGNTAPPVLSTVANTPAGPQIRVLDKSGQTIQLLDLTSRGLSVGRQASNDIVLATQEVSRQHLQIQWDGRQASIKDLGSSNGTVLGSERLLPQVAHPWPDRQQIRLGPFWLRLEGSSQLASAQSVAAGIDQTALYGGGAAFTQRPVAASISSGSTPTAGNRIGVVVEPATLTITPGQPLATVKVTLTNMGMLVDWLTITVEGVPREWVQGPTYEVQLNPGTQETIELKVTVARIPANRAQPYPVVIRARSREKPNESGTARVQWTVLPFKEDALRLEPRRVVGRGQAKYAVTLRNDGNALVHYELIGEDDEQKMHYLFRQSVVDLEPGTEMRIPLTVKDRNFLLGKDQRLPFQVRARPTGSTIPLNGQAEFVNKALLPGWVIPVATAVVVLAGVILAAYTGLIPPLKQPAQSMAAQMGIAVPTAAPTATPTATPMPTPTAVPTATMAPGVPTPTPVPIVSASNGTMRGNFSFNFDQGIQASSTSRGDVLWNIQNDPTRTLQVVGNAQLVNLGLVNFDSVTAAQLQSLNYSTTPINGNNDSTNQLVTNDVFAVHTNGGNYAKVLVQTYGPDLLIQWVTYKGQ